MSAFDKIIGYETIKNELKQVCDMLKNQEVYQSMGARLPRGVLLTGEPGLGKTLMAKCMIEESGLTTYTVRRNKGSDGFVGEITATFEKAKQSAPSIVFLDDMDKFANEDNMHCDAEEYVAVQAGIDDVKDYEVFILATVNDEYKLPSSLTRSGRFDRKIDFERPSEKDAVMIIEHYLANKKLSADVNMDDLSKMISYSSCAELETILNEAAIHAAYARKNAIEMQDIVQAVLRMQYNAPDNLMKTSAEDIKKAAVHEAGHLVVCETLCQNSVGLASIKSSGRDSMGGFIHRCKELNQSEDDIYILLAGKAAVEILGEDLCADGCQQDIKRAFNIIRNRLSTLGTCGLGMLDVANNRFPDTSESLNARNEAVTQALLERYLMKTRSILLQNTSFLQRVAVALEEKQTLLYSDIQKLKEECELQQKAG